MGKIVVSENITLDGVLQDPTGTEGFSFGGWFARMSDKDREAWAKTEFDEALGAAALLMGARTYEFFARGWTTRPGEWADQLRYLPKFVLSSTVQDPEWVNTTILTGDPLAEVSKLKQAVDGEIIVYGSGKLVHMLMEHDLVDELRLIVHSSVVGGGERLFGGTASSRPVHLVDVRTVGDELAMLVYETVRAGADALS